MVIAGWVMTLLVIAALALLAYFKLISTEATAALIGIVIGSLFRREK